MQELANTAWAVSTLEMWDYPLLDSISAEAMRKCRQANWQPFLDCADIFSLSAPVKQILRQPVQDCAGRLAPRTSSIYPRL
mmetsp:Transcript_108682/g.335694  ORF Transcript_108682/g.335694 Transcript_108682/m.335694 type:complete len:81 (+) Transcript_108682:126-368(+)